MEQTIATLDVQNILNEIKKHTFPNFLGLSIDFAPQKQNCHFKHTCEEDSVKNL